MCCRNKTGLILSDRDGGSRAARIASLFNITPDFRSFSAPDVSVLEMFFWFQMFSVFQGLLAFKLCLVSKVFVFSAGSLKCQEALWPC